MAVRELLRGQAQLSDPFAATGPAGTPGRRVQDMPPEAQSPFNLADAPPGPLLGESPAAALAPPMAAAPAKVAAAPQLPFGKMTDEQKARYLAGVMHDSAGTLKENGVSQHMEELLAGVMMNEGGTNTRRDKIGKYFNGLMDDGGGGGLLKKLERADLAKLQSDPEELKKFEKGMGEDQRMLTERALAGEIDLAGLHSKDKSVAAAARKQVTEAGIHLRTQQYGEYSHLYDRQHAGEKLSKEEQSRLSTLGDLGGAAMGFDRLDIRNGVDAKMKDVRGVSTERFAEIYEDSQVRFEPVHYRRWRDQYEQQTAANAGLPADKQKAIKLGSSIGDYTLKEKDRDALSQNYDLLADFNTSFGTPQVMGLYGHSGEMKVKDGQGQAIDFSVERLKAASRRSTPNEEDVQLLLGELGGHGVKFGSKDMTAEDMTTKYNGAPGQNANYNDYVRKLKGHVTDYQRAEGQRAAEQAKQKTAPHAHFAE